MIVLNLKNEFLSGDFNLSTHLINQYDDFYHMHNYIEIFYVIDGSIKHSFNGSVSTLLPGDMFLLHPNDVHCFLREHGNTSSHRDIMISETEWKRACEYLGIDPACLADGKHFRSTISSNQILRFEHLLSKISASVSKKTLHNAYIDLLCSNLVMIFYDLDLGTSQSSYPIWLKQLLDKLNMPGYFLADLDSLLSTVNYDHSYVCRMFKKYVGMTMTNYINLLRLNYATMLLQTKNDSITRIAFDSGFPNISYFNRCFKKQYGLTPSEFKKDASSVILDKKTIHT